MTDWTEIFRAGRHTDSAGHTREWTAGDVAAIAASYDPGYSDAPAVVGHPETNSPAFGWVAQLKAEGGKLLAKFRQLDPGFVDAVRAGRFKHRSVALYPDLDGRGLYLRHVGFLGATPPAVKGLAAAQFKEGDSVAFEFALGGDEDMDQNALTAWFDEKFKPVLEFVKRTPAATAGAPAGSDPLAVGSAAFNEAVRAAAKGLVDESTATFSERVKTLETENAALKTQTAELKTQLAMAASSRTRAAVDALIEYAAQEGRWIPAFNQDGTREMLYAQAAGAPPIEFGEPDKDGKRKSLSGLDQVKSYLAKLPKQVLFGELTGNAGDNKAAVKSVGFNAPVDGNVIVHNFDLAERANQIEIERKVGPGEALLLAARERGA